MSEFQVIPAVDIRDGKCVRLYQGRSDEERVFDSEPLDAAMRWQDEGARLLHVVDLDGAFSGVPVNRDLISAIIARLSIPVQVGGGIRSTDDALGYIEAGSERIVVGTRAFADPDWLFELAERLGERLAVGVDAKEGRIATGGWLELSETTTSMAVEKLAVMGVKRIIYTEIARDGTLAGPDLGRIEEVARESSIPLIASGGVASVDDLRRVRGMKELGVEGVIVGTALYRGSFTFAEALTAIEQEGGS